MEQDSGEKLLDAIEKPMRVFCKSVIINPNTLTGARILMVPFIIWLSSNEQNAWAVTLFAIAWISDLFDGPMARAHGKESQLGAVLDPLADKVLFIAPLCLFYGKIFWLIFVGLVAIESILIVQRLVKLCLNQKQKSEKKPNLKANFAGKAKSFIEQLAVCLFLTHWWTNADWFLISLNLVLIIALIMATMSLLAHLKQ